METDDQESDDLKQTVEEDVFFAREIEYFFVISQSKNHAVKTGWNFFGKTPLFFRLNAVNAAIFPVNNGFYG